MKSKTNPKQAQPTKSLDSFPMRINKYLAHKGVATRTGVDELIKNNKVFINGVQAKLGDKVLETDDVQVKSGRNAKKLFYLVYYKPRGVVSTNPQGEEKDILQSAKIDPKKYAGAFPVGRIDKDSHGLMILTNDGRVTDRLLNPKYDHEKEYVVKIDRPFTPAFIRHMQDGVDIGDGITKPAKVKKVSEDTFNIVLTEGRNRQIRRMTEKLGYTVRDLKRTRVQNVNLGKISENTYREIEGAEKEEFLKSIGL
jgi:23S rRNA pseudouridine2604 synthase